MGLIIIFLLANYLQNKFKPTVAENVQKESEKVAKSGKLIDEQNPIKIRKDKEGIEYVQKTIIQSHSIENTLPSETQKYVEEKILPQLEKAGKDLREFDKVKAVLNGEAKAATIQVKDKYFKITYKQGNLYAVAERDSLGEVKPLVYKYDIPNLTKVRSGEKKTLFFSQKDVVVDEWSFNDPNFSVGGVEHYSLVVKERRNVFNLKAEVGMQIGFKNPINSNAKAGIVAVFNQDGFISPNIGIGKIINLSNGATDTYGQAGINFNILKIRK